MRAIVAAIILGVGLVATACGPAEPEYSLAAAPDGHSFKLEGISEVTRPNGEAALLLIFRTDLDLTDGSAMQSELEAVWQYLRPQVEDRDLRVAVIRASQWEVPSWERRGRAIQYVLERSADGQWTSRADTTSSTDLAR